MHGLHNVFYIVSELELVVFTQTLQSAIVLVFQIWLTSLYSGSPTGSFFMLDLRILIAGLNVLLVYTLNREIMMPAKNAYLFVFSAIVAGPDVYLNWNGYMQSVADHCLLANCSQL